MWTLKMQVAIFSLTVENVQHRSDILSIMSNCLEEKYNSYSHLKNVKTSFFEHAVNTGSTSRSLIRGRGIQDPWANDKRSKKCNVSSHTFMLDWCGNRRNVRNDYISCMSSTSTPNQHVMDTLRPCFNGVLSETGFIICVVHRKLCILP